MAQMIKKIVKTFKQEGIFGFVKKVHHWFWFRWQVLRGRVQPLGSSLFYNYITDMGRVDPRVNPRLRGDRSEDDIWIRSKDDKEEILNRVQDDKKITINWVIPDMSAGSGGHMTIFRIVKYLQDFGHQNRVYIFGGCRQKSDKALKKFVDENFIETGAQFFTTLDEIKDCHALIATSWQTAYPVKAIRNAYQKFYFVQDFEPWFFPMGAEYKFAENTYRFGFYHITAGPWLTKILKENYQAKADYFNLAYDHKIYHSNYVKKQRQRPRLAFYSRPVTPRRAFEMGMQTFRELDRRGFDFEAYFFGMPKMDFDVKFKYRNLGILSHRQLAYLYNNIDLGIVFSTTNYSLLPHEMMACRCPVLDLKGPTLEGIFENDQNIFLAEPDPIKIADKIIWILENKKKCHQVVASAYQYVQQFSWKKSTKKVEKILLCEIS